MKFLMLYIWLMGLCIKPLSTIIASIMIKIQSTSGNMHGNLLVIGRYLSKSANTRTSFKILYNQDFIQPKNNKWEIEQVRAKHGLPYEDRSFVRKRKVGGFKEELASAFISRINSWINNFILH
uniref:Uncharacterized protein n=1 Tax=Glossina austeni TaxID=7395 RepID=A0A1A9VLJ2_GLOAU